MNDITALSELSFFRVGKYEYKNTEVCDFSNIPRPHYCMGLILKGEGRFNFNDRSVLVKRGDIIFVPVTSEYVSVWRGDPDILYISMHFSFGAYALFPRYRSYEIQRVPVHDFERMEKDFRFALENFAGDRSSRMAVLSIFYRIMSVVFPQLKYTSIPKLDKRIKKAVEYIDLNYRQDISINHLARLCNMSVSYFYNIFKKSVGMTPIAYKNKVCINHAALILINEPHKLIEEISAELGFYSSTYFRRVFKDITGRTPREYRKLGAEL